MALKDNNIPFHHNNFTGTDAKNTSKKLPHLNENESKKIENEKNKKKKEFMKTFGNFSHQEKQPAIRDIKSQAGSDIMNFKKTTEVC
jgi:hypothetical protein